MKIKKQNQKASAPDTTRKRGRPSRSDARYISIASATDNFIWRATPELLERVRERASHDHRSINQTINFLVEFALNNLEYKKM